MNEHRFWNKVVKTKGCWVWIGRSAKGYGYAYSPKPGFAHRLSYEMANGNIPEGHVVHHKCANRLCVRPDHLVVMPHGLHSAMHLTNDDTCNAGHPRTVETTYIAPSGERRCRTCVAARQREYKARVKAARR